MINKVPALIAAALILGSASAASAAATHRRAVVLDARRGDIFGAVYDEHAQVVIAETVAKLPAWLESLPEGDYEFIAGSAIAGTAIYRRMDVLPGRGFAALVPDAAVAERRSAPPVPPTLDVEHS